LADLVLGDALGSLTLAEQIRLVAGLRWRLLRNKLRQKNNRLDLIGMTAAGILGAVLVFGLTFAFYTSAHEFIASRHAGWMALLFWGIFAWWQLFPIFVAGFGGNFEFRTLLRFPLNRRAFYLIGLAYGLADFSSLAALCWLVAITSGACSVSPRLLPIMILVCSVFLLLNVTMERLIGSWLERLLARRRSRELFFALFIMAMISFQFITPLAERYGNSAKPLLNQLLPYFVPFPGSLAGAAIANAVRGSSAGALIAVGGLLVYVVILSSMLWLRFAAQYRGEELSETAPPLRSATTSAASGRSGVTDSLRLLPPQVAEVLRKEIHYLLRNGFSFVLLIMPPMMILLLTLQGSSSHAHDVSTLGFSRSAFFPGVMGYLVLVLMAPAYNTFAYEGRGIQTYFMAPLRFRHVFLGKNLMMASVVGLEVVLTTIVFAYRVGLPEKPALIATLVAVVFTVVGQMAIANWSSLSFPRRLNFGQMRGQRQSGMAVLVAFGAQILLGGISALLFFVGRWTADTWLPAEAFVFLAAAAIAGYVASLDALSNFAERKKENLIEALCR
jgi:ABC-2 type transport system permease protein